MSRKPKPAEPKPVTGVHCVIHTRKSTEEGLEQEFNSLNAQRESHGRNNSLQSPYTVASSRQTKLAEVGQPQCAYIWKRLSSYVRQTDHAKLVLMNDSRDLVSSRIQPQTRTEYLQTHNLSEVAFRLSNLRDFPGYVISIGSALTDLAATCCWKTTYEGRRKTAEISRAV